MEFKIEIKNKKGVFDPLGNGIKKNIKDLGISGVKKVNVSQVFIISGDISEADAKRIAEELLADPVTEEYSIGSGLRAKGKGQRVVEIAYNPGVMDPVEESARKAIKDMGIYGVKFLRTERKYHIEGKITENDFKNICEKLLYNKVIQHVAKGQGARDRGQVGGGYKFKLIIVDILGADDKKLIKISKSGQLFLNLKEMQEIKKYFKKLGRNPTDCELETIAQTWSEHCGHKTFRGVIDYEERAEGEGCRAKKSKIDNLLKSTVMKVTNELKKPWCVSVFKDNAGIIRFDDEDNICFKVETHNHPSALEPYGGAGTGIGGVIRDILGVGLGAKPIMNTDIFCFGLPDTAHKNVPKGMLHPKRIMKGVVSGVRDYGNRMGIPTANGAVLFDEHYTGNPLVYCGTVGIMPKDKSFKASRSKDLIVAVGGRTGRDGIHGATFSSGELTHESETVSGGAVQIGNPITEKKLTDTLLKARDRNLYTAVTDCGAGGFSSAVGEMGQELGAEVDLEKAPLKYKGLSYTEIWISEAQERMVLSVPRENLKELMDIFKKEDVEAVVIGCFTSNKRLKLRYNGNVVCDLDMGFLHDGIPRFERKAVWARPSYKECSPKNKKDFTQDLLKILSSWNVCSKEWVIRQYDHEVQGQSVLKPLVGIKNDGPGDASIIRPKFDSKKGIIVSNGINPRFGFIDPYWMAGSCIDEALRQVIAVGGSLKKTALLDNFCWGNTDKPDRLGGLVRASFGCYDIASSYGVPFISGKDSLNNEYSVHGESVSIPGTLLISAISVMDDVTKAVTMDFKEKGNLIYIIGETKDEMGGSHYNLINNSIGNNAPIVDAASGLKIFNRMSEAAGLGLLRACHDLSEGGIAAALAEMAFSGGFGTEIKLKAVPCKVKRNEIILFSESNTRFIAEVRKEDKKIFENLMKGVSIGLLGEVSEKKGLRVYGLEGKKVIDADIDKLKEAWQKPLRW
ncbi:MAG: phosphoribosylformylglycinamidine synthase subunit PurL [Candidatus Omnitrophica bacterium CG22_combo_CG10-13_8_21_14_all_43_16]|nr:MAG: phosphoribosylformylglycinamidine synthase subunit PurL [Candidatus Omnitrophica bacterium CG22_combo_CG10-13_8_21_14_all_43_16]